MSAENNALPQMPDEKKSSDETIDDLIILTGCGMKTQWKFPDNLERCPMTGCWKTYSNRLKIILHYKKRHAEKSILCYICNAPMCVPNDKDFENHYRRLHPDVEMPIRFVQKVKQETQTENVKSILQENNVNKSTANTNRKDAEVDDLITLSGLGQVTYWRFPPNDKRCPVLKCQQNLESRSLAIAHYRKQHANNSIFCRPCNKPLHDINNLCIAINHFNINHPREKLPTYLLPSAPTKHPQKNHTKSQIDNNNDDNKKLNDLIKLRGGGKITYWRFPKNVTRCPVVKCLKQFQARSSVIAHYRQCHTRNATLCSICEQPISYDNLSKHMKNQHQNTNVPLKREFKCETETKTNNQKLSDNEDDDDGKHEGTEDDVITLTACNQAMKWRFPQNQTQCPAHLCRMELKTRSKAIEHFKKHHAMHYLRCTICDKALSARHIRDFKKHWNAKHPKVKFPIEMTNNDREPSPKPEQIQNISSTPRCETDTVDDDDVITLFGSGQTTSWKFPEKIAKCPVSSCSASFSYRRSAINHFRSMHANDSVYCSKCDKPITAYAKESFKRHCERMHPQDTKPSENDTSQLNQSQPYVKVELSSPSVVDKSKPAQDQPKDLVTLTGWGQRSTWRFRPYKNKTCPVQKCYAKFNSLTAGIRHYKQKHAANSVLCNICKIPIVIAPTNYYEAHFKNEHPEVKMPLKIMQQKMVPQKTIEPNQKVDEQKQHCKMCNKSIPITQFSLHVKEMHSVQKVFCPLVECPFTAEQMDTVRAHWTKNHANLRFPEIREENNYTYSTNIPIDTNDNENPVSPVSPVSGSPSQEAPSEEPKILHPLPESWNESAESSAKLKTQLQSKENKRMLSNIWTSIADEVNENAAKRQKTETTQCQMNNNDSAPNEGSDSYFPPQICEVNNGYESSSPIEFKPVLLPPPPNQSVSDPIGISDPITYSNEIIDLDLEFPDIVDLDFEDETNQNVSEYPSECLFNTFTSPIKQPNLPENTNITIDIDEHESASANELSTINDIASADVQQTTESVQQIDEQSLIMNENDTIYVPDSDEENENRNTDNQVPNLNQSHIRTWSVLMMAVPHTKIEPN